MIYRTVDGDMLDAICARHYGDAEKAVAVLDANPGLAVLGPVYPAGVLITLPDLPEPDTTTPAPIRLWGAG